MQIAIDNSADRFRWVCSCLMGHDRTNAVIGLYQIRGNGRDRETVQRAVKELNSSLTAPQFAHSVYEMCNSEGVNDCLIVIDESGVGAAAASILKEQYHLEVARVNWAHRMKKKAYDRRFLNQKAYAYFTSSIALLRNRVSFIKSSNAVDQALSLDISVNKSNQVYTPSLHEMRKNSGFQTPDQWDVFCLLQLVAIND